MILEACVGNLREAKQAEKSGAHQIELCDRLDLDGTSPDLDVILDVSTELNIPIKVIVNPNPFNYVYTSSDIQKIVSYIKRLNETPIQGIVFGPLTKDGYPDLDAIERIAEHTSLPITYHKAIDGSSDILKSTRRLMEQNIVRSILSSGGAATALEGVETLKKMSALLDNSPIELIAAGKISSSNLQEVHDKLGLTYYHGKKIVGALN